MNKEDEILYLRTFAWSVGCEMTEVMAIEFLEDIERGKGGDSNERQT